MSVLTERTEKKQFAKTVAALVIPMAIQNLINVGVQSADVVMLGMVGQTALSAASLAGQVQFVMMLVFFGLASGASVLTAQYWGKGDTRTIEKVIAISLRISISVALIFAVSAVVFPQYLMRIFTPEQALITEGARYLRLVAPSYLIVAFTSVYLTILRSVEKVIISTVVYSISLFVNIGFNAIFIFGLFGMPEMGIAGAAIGTTLARIVELVIVSIYMAKNKMIRLRWKDFFTKHGVLMQDFMRYAMPTMINELVWSLGVATNAVIIGHLGEAAVAANSVGNVTRQLATVVSFGVANATAIMIGKALGTGDMDTAKLYAKRMVRLAMTSGLCGGLLIVAIRPIILSFMRLSDQANGYLSFLLFVLAGYVLLQTFNATMIVGVFRGGGDTRFGLFLDTVCMWGFSILISAVAAFIFHWPVEVVYIIIMADEIVKMPLALIRYKKGVWLRNVTR